MKPGPHQYKPLQIVGLGPIYQLQVLHALDLMLVITGKERLFSCVGLKDLENRLRQSQMGSTISAITSSQIERVKSCHLFACSKVKINIFLLHSISYYRTSVKTCAHWEVSMKIIQREIAFQKIKGTVRITSS